MGDNISYRPAKQEAVSFEHEEEGVWRLQVTSEQREGKVIEAGKIQEKGRTFADVIEFFRSGVDEAPQSKLRSVYINRDGKNIISVHDLLKQEKD